MWFWSRLSNYFVIRILSRLYQYSLMHIQSVLIKKKSDSHHETFIWFRYFIFLVKFTSSNIWPMFSKYFLRFFFVLYDSSYLNIFLPPSWCNTCMIQTISKYFSDSYLLISTAYRSMWFLNILNFDPHLIISINLSSMLYLNSFSYSYHVICGPGNLYFSILTFERLSILYNFGLTSRFISP